jgi:hypothetical protein
MSAPQSGSNLGRGRWLPLAAGIAASLWVLALMPATAYFFHDADGGFFIQGAYDWRVAGLIPQIDVHSDYGPLSFLVRYAFQAFLGDRILAEVLLAMAGYGLAYGFLFSCFRRMAGSVALAALLLAVALLLLPRYYKFPIVLVPALAAWSALRLVDASLSRGGAIAAGIALAVAFLFRHDYFVFAAVVVSVGWFRGTRREPAAQRTASLMALAFAVVAGPWIAIVAWKRGLWPYLMELAGVTGSKTVGFGLPHPLLHWAQPAETVAFAAAYTLPALALARLLIMRKRSIEEAARDAAWIGVAAGLAFLPQSMHRADVPHLLQVIPGCLLAVAGAWRLAPRRDGALARYARPEIACMTVLLGAAAVVGAVALPWESGQPWSDRARLTLVPATQVDAAAAPGGISLLEDVLRVLRTCAPVGTAVAVYPMSPQLAYFAGRVHGGAYLVLTPGYYDDERHLSAALTTLRRDDVTLVLWDEALVFDGRPERHSLSTHAMLHDSVVRSFARLGRVGAFTIYADPAAMKARTFLEAERRCV